MNPFMPAAPKIIEPKMVLSVALSAIQPVLDSANTIKQSIASPPRKKPAYTRSLHRMTRKKYPIDMPNMNWGKFNRGKYKRKLFQVSSSVGMAFRTSAAPKTSPAEITKDVAWLTCRVVVHSAGNSR